MSERKIVRTRDVMEEHFTEIDGLPDATVYSGIWDTRGRLWLSTGRGLSRFNPQTLEFRNFGTEHGLQGSEFNFAAGFRSTDGKLFFGGLNGFNAFDPDALSADGPAFIDVRIRKGIRDDLPPLKVSHIDLKNMLMKNSR